VILMLKITDIKIYPFDTGNRGGQVRGYADVTIEDALLLKGFKIIEAEKGGLFVGFPNQKTRDGKYKDLVIPLNNEIKEYLRKSIIDRYKELYMKKE
jgi:stage V sporulation protein G